MTEQTFSDAIAQGYYRQGESELSTTQSADEVLQKADAFARHDSQANLKHAACYYLAAAHFLETSDPAKSPHAYDHHRHCWPVHQEPFTPEINRRLASVLMTVRHEINRACSPVKRIAFNHFTFVLSRHSFRLAEITFERTTLRVQEGTRCLDRFVNWERLAPLTFS
jgi:hypothetical protein